MILMSHLLSSMPPARSGRARVAFQLARHFCQIVATITIQLATELNFPHNHNYIINKLTRTNSTSEWGGGAECDIASPKKSVEPSVSDDYKEGGFEIVRSLIILHQTSDHLPGIAGDGRTYQGPSIELAVSCWSNCTALKGDSNCLICETGTRPN